MQKYIFPMNYKYSAKFLGIINYSTLLPLAIYANIIGIILYVLKIDFFLSFGIFIILVLPPFLLLFIHYIIYYPFNCLIKLKIILFCLSSFYAIIIIYYERRSAFAVINNG